jgi:hypothetical protein
MFLKIKNIGKIKDAEIRLDVSRIRKYLLFLTSLCPGAREIFKNQRQESFQTDEVPFLSFRDQTDKIGIKISSVCVS